jgi:hypothetical protein
VYGLDVLISCNVSVDRDIKVMLYIGSLASIRKSFDWTVIDLNTYLQKKGKLLKMRGLEV